MQILGFDLKAAFRTLTRARFVSVLAVVAFALGIGVTTAVFSIFNSVLLEPLPYPQPEQLVVVYGTQPACPTCPASFPKYHDWKSRNQVFSAIGGSTLREFVMTGRGEPARVLGAATTASLGDVFAVPPILGRWYTEQEDRDGGPKLVVLSHAFWKSHYDASRAIVGQRLLFDGEPYEIVGVMPESFTHRKAEVFVPLQRKLDPATRGNHFIAVYARLKPDVPLARATADMRALGHVLAREFGHNHGIDVRSYTEAVVGSVRTPLAVLLGAVFFVLLIACANVANLMLASGLARRRELAVRLALGATRWHVARQLVGEAVLLALVGGAAGAALAHWAVRGFVFLAEDRLPRASTIHVDAGVLTFAAVVSIVVGVACGAWPLVLLETRQLAPAVREGDVRTGTGGGGRFGSSLVVAEIAIAFTLLVAAGLLVKNLVLLNHRDSGIRKEGVVAFDLGLAGPLYQSDDRIVAFYRDLYTRLASVGTIESVGLTSHLPMYNYGWNGEMSIEGGNPWPDNQAPLVEYRWIHGDYLETMGIPVVRGRGLDSRDGAGTRTVLINEVMAEKFWPGQDPIGKRFGQGTDASGWFQVVGVIRDVRSKGLTATTPYEFYRTIEQSALPRMTVVIRTAGSDPKSIVPTARAIVASLDPLLPVANVQTLEEVVAASVGQPRLMSALTALFGGLAGLLAMVGIYGVMAYNVRRQRREFGVRLALGATGGRLGRLIVGRILMLAVMGVAIGIVGSWGAGKVLRAMLHDVQPTDPAVFAATAATVLTVALVASALPARTAGRTDPIVVLRDN